MTDVGILEGMIWFFKASEAEGTPLAALSALQNGYLL